MAGIYIHIPFCRKACYYCDFHFSVSLKQKDALVDALIKEIQYKKNYLYSETIETIYIGGGTPSVLTTDQLQQIFDTIYNTFSVKQVAEITLEVNPDDCNDSYVRGLAKLPVNRISAGIQSFNNNELKLMNRRHTMEEAIDSVKRLKDAGYLNLNVDIIYGIPGSTLETWQNTLNKTLELNVDHISSYHLTYEPKTIFTNWLKKEKIIAIQEDMSVQQFNLLIDVLKRNSYMQYEISNFARNNKYSNHNMGYWFGKKYIGIGPSAHSYNGISRNWNISVNSQYIKSINNNTPYYQSENIDIGTRYNEYIMTSLRTIWGIDLKRISTDFGSEYSLNTEKNIEKFVNSGDMIKKGNVARLTNKGIFVSDYVISEFFIV